MESILKSKNEIPPDGFYELKYENFCRNPNEEIKKIFNFLSLSYTKIIDKNINFIKKSSIGKWKNEVDPEELKLLKHIKPL